VLCLSGTKVLLVQEELPKQQVTVLPQHPSSLDLAPCDFFFFSRLKEKLRGRRFLLAEEIVAATREAVWDLPANISALFPAAIPTLADLHSGQWRLF
jgi:hypothetical protein